MEFLMILERKSEKISNVGIWQKLNWFCCRLALEDLSMVSAITPFLIENLLNR